MARDQFTIRMDPLLLNRMDNWMHAQPVPPTRTAVIEAAVKAFLDAQETKTK